MAGIVILCCGYVLSQFFRSFLAVLAPTLIDELGVGADDLSFALGAWFGAFSLMQFPVGIWLDRYGPRRTGGFLLAVAAAGAAMFALSTGAAGLIGAMALIGIGCSAVLMSAMYIFARQFDAARFAALSSVFIAGGNLGNILGSAPLAAAVAAWGWRATLGGLSAASLLVAIGVLAVVRDPARVESPNVGREGGFRDLLAIGALWPIFPCIFLGYAVAGGMRGIWSGPYFAGMHGWSNAEIGGVALAMAMALTVGGLGYAPLDRVFNTRKWVVMAGAMPVLAAIGGLAIRPAPDAATAALAMTAICLFGTSYAVTMAHGRAFVPLHLTGRGVTLLNFFSISGAGFMQFVTGKVFAWSGGAAAGAEAYRAVFIAYAVALAASLALYAWSRDARPSEDGASTAQRPIGQSPGKSRPWSAG